MTQNINLYQGSTREALNPLDPRAAVGYVGSALLVLVLTTVYVRHQATSVEPLAAASDTRLSEAHAEVDAATKRAATFVPDPQLQRLNAQRQHELAKRRQALTLLSGKDGSSIPEGFSGRLEGLARQAPAGLWLTAVSFAPDDILIVGRSLDPELVPSFVRHLSSEAALQGDRLASLEIKRDGTDVATPLATAANASAQAVQAAPPGASASSPAVANYVDFTVRGAAGSVLARAPARPGSGAGTAAAGVAVAATSATAAASSASAPVGLSAPATSIASVATEGRRP